MTGSGSTLQFIDDALAQWNNRLAAVAENLLELQADATYRTLTGVQSGPASQIKAPLRGASAARLGPALDAMLGIYERFTALQETIERAARLRATLPVLFGTEAKLAELRHLLFERSIPVPTSQVALDRRDLLSGVQAPSCVTPEEMLTSMVAAFSGARDAVIAAREAWVELAGSLERIDREIAWLDRRCDRSHGAALLQMRSALGEVREAAPSDPLGALESLRTRVEPMVARAGEAVHAAERQRQRVAQGRALLERLVALHAEALAVSAEARGKIAQVTALPTPLAAETAQQLADWLGRLERTMAEGRLEAAEVGLGSWLRAAEGCVTRETECLAAWRGLLDARGELRGRLDALRAKARSYGLSETPELAGLARNAEQLLHTRPVPLAEAAAAVAGYEKRLSGGKGRV